LSAALSQKADHRNVRSKDGLSGLEGAQQRNGLKAVADPLTRRAKTNRSTTRTIGLHVLSTHTDAMINTTRTA
jgi:hypothetical protein